MIFIFFLYYLLSLIGILHLTFGVWIYHHHVYFYNLIIVSRRLLLSLQPPNGTIIWFKVTILIICQIYNDFCPVSFWNFSRPLVSTPNRPIYHFYQILSKSKLSFDLNRYLYSRLIVSSIYPFFYLLLTIVSIHVVDWISSKALYISLLFCERLTKLFGFGARLRYKANL